jgi:hypothetical protein
VRETVGCACPADESGATQVYRRNATAASGVDRRQHRYPFGLTPPKRPSLHEFPGDDLSVAAEGKRGRRCEREGGGSGLFAPQCEEVSIVPYDRSTIGAYCGRSKARHVTRSEQGSDSRSFLSLGDVSPPGEDDHASDT